MNRQRDQDPRVREGPAIGIEPQFELSNVELNANFYVTGSMSRSMTASLATSTPTIVESLGRSLPELSGLLRIFDNQPNETYPGLYEDHFGSMALGSQRGFLAIRAPDWYVVHLYLPPDQFAALLPLLCAGPTAMLRIEIERTLEEGLLDNEIHFWNERLSPVIRFNEFQISVATTRYAGPQ
jgi:hypothetical protein